MTNPTLPPSLAAEFRSIRDRLSALERGEQSVTYRDRLTVNDASVARKVAKGDGDRDVYSAALVNPQYPVLVARWHVQLFGTAAASVRLRASLGGSTKETQTWNLTGKPGPNWSFHSLEVAWLHGMPLDEWQDTETVSRTRRGNVEFRCHVTNEHEWFFRNPSMDADLQGVGFTAPQSAVLQAWITKQSNMYDSWLREPEYVFLAPLAAFPTASDEGTLLPGSVIDV